MGLGDDRRLLARDGLAGIGSIPQQLVAHLGYSALPLLIAALIGVPAGVAIGHRGGKAPSW